MKNLLTIADSKIPLANSAFSQFGKVVVVDNKAILSQFLRSANILLIRSETRVDADLLESSGVVFVGSPTSGVDHIDLDYLHSKNIGFANAPGSNAQSVAEYVLAVLLTIGRKRSENLQGKTLGVIGLGNIGRIVAKMGEGLGMKVLKNDPPLKAKTGDLSFVRLEELFSADFITLHVPLTRAGKYPTWHLFDKKVLNNLNSNCVLINSARGAVVDNAALKDALANNRLSAAVLDVWEDEPDIDCELLKMVEIATPHIAGYSWDGKVRGTSKVFQAACNYFGVKSKWQPVQPENEISGRENCCLENDFEDCLFALTKCFYDINVDDHNMQKILNLPKLSRAKYFSGLRNSYRVRREFSSRPVIINNQSSSISSDWIKKHFFFDLR